MITALEPTVTVMDVLAQCGWQPDRDSYSDEPALKYNFGNFELSAGTFMEFDFRRLVFFQGIFNNSRTIADVFFKTPVQLVSREQLFAWVAHGLRDIPVAITPGWLKEGRLHGNLLPWEQEQEAYRKRPQASVARDWMRLLAKQLRAEAELAAGMDTCSVHFDGDALRFKLGGKSLVVQASGDVPWTDEAIVRLSSMRWPSKRWMHDPVWVEYWDGHLKVGNFGFAATIAPRSASGCQESCATGPE